MNPQLSTYTLTTWTVGCRIRRNPSRAASRTNLPLSAGKDAYVLWNQLRRFTENAVLDKSGLYPGCIMQFTSSEYLLIDSAYPADNLPLESVGNTYNAASSRISSRRSTSGTRMLTNIETSTSARQR
jgi:hypothetical protein